LGTCVSKISRDIVDNFYIPLQLLSLYTLKIVKEQWV